jgi:hypothetical protein
MIVISDYLKGLLPGYIIGNDSYKDMNAQGFVERFVRMCGAEIDDEFYSKIDEVIDQVTPYSARSEFLNYLAYNLGDLPSWIDDEAQYRRFLSFMISVYKIKGRVLSYEAMMLTLGLDIIITELAPVGDTYDASPVLTYDQEGRLYDQSCSYCSDYDINLSPYFMGLITDDLDAATGWNLDAGSSIATSQLTLVGVAEAEAVKQFPLLPSTNYTVSIDVDSITNAAELVARLVASDTLTTGTAYLSLSPITVAAKVSYTFTTSADANQYLQLDVDTNGETIVINQIRFWLTDDTLNPVINTEVYDNILLLVSLVEPINANLNEITFDAEVVSIQLITVTIDGFGDLVYNNDADPLLILTMDSNGSLIISGPQASRYFVSDGDLFYIQTT